MQTNGTSIDDELVGLFREHRVFVSVSLDGPPELHDAARIQRGGRGSHARVVEGVRRLLEARIPHQVEVTVGRHNVHAPEAVVRHLIDLHGGNVRADNLPEGGARFTIDVPAEPRARA